MKKNITQKKLSLDKQTIQKLDNKKLSTVHAGEAGTTTIIVSAATATASSAPTIVCSITILF